LTDEPRPLPPTPLPEATGLPAEKAPATARARLKGTDIKGKEEPLSGAPAVEAGAQPAPMETAPTEAEAPPLTARITPDTLPQQAASLRLAEEGRKLLEAGEFQKALTQLEKAISLDSGNPYAYYYLAQAHHQLSQYRQSLGFLDIVEAAFSQEPLWLARVYALEGENYRALGFFDLADRKYLKALALVPSHRVALEGLTYFPPEIISPAKGVTGGRN